jgi:hypothetical protein
LLLLVVVMRLDGRCRSPVRRLARGSAPLIVIWFDGARRCVRWQR